VADNTGGTDGHRSLNYLAVRYHEIYKRTAEVSWSGFCKSVGSVQVVQTLNIQEGINVVFINVVPRMRARRVAIIETAVN
jgi:PatG C-terminal